MMESSRTTPVVQIKLEPHQSIFIEPNAYQIMSDLRNTAGSDTDVDMVRATPPPDADILRNPPMMGIEAVIASVALPSLAFVEDKYKPELNPNVAMEWGWMRAMGRRVLFLMEETFSHGRADGAAFDHGDLNGRHPSPE